jgi:uncharacterized protein (AIM24 family)
MAKFTIRDVEGMRQLQIDIDNESVRARKGAMSNTRGQIKLIPRVPGPLDVIRSIYNDEARIRPWYEGTGTILLQPTLAGYHLLDVVPDEKWVLEPGVYWASEGRVKLGLHRDPAWTSFFLGDGFLEWKTGIWGRGKVAINAPGPVEVVDVAGGEFRAQGRIVLGRTSGLKFTSGRPASWPRHMISGQKRLRVFEGTGKVLVCFTPFWNDYMYKRLTGETIERSLFE